MLQFLSNHFAPHGAGEWAILIVILALCVAGSIAGIKAFGNGFKQQAGTVSITKRGAVTLAFLVGVILVTLTACADTATANKEVDAGGIGSDSKATATLNGYDEEAFVGEIDDAMLQTWANDFFQREVTLQEVRTCYNGKCHPRQEENRITAVRQAMQKYIDVNSKGLEGPVLFPMYDLLAAYYDGDWDNLTASERQDIIDEALRAWAWDMIGNPETMDELLQFYQDCPVIIDRNPWLQEFIKQFNDSYLRKEEPIGNAFWFETQNNNALVYTEYYAVNALKSIRLFFESFELLEDPLQSWQTAKNWYLPHCDNADLNRTTPNPNQIKYLSIILVDKYKEAGDGITVGINAFDQRLEEYKGVEKPAAPDSPATPQTPSTPTTPSTPNNPVPVTPNRPTPTPTPTPTPVPDKPTIRKDPSDGSVEQGNANRGGGNKSVPDGIDEFQYDKPVEKNHPAQGSEGDKSSKPNETAGSQKRQETSNATQSSTTVRSDGKTESSGNRGQDHNVSNPEGGATFSGTAPDKNKNSANTSTQTVKTTQSSNSSGGTNVQTEVSSPVGEQIGSANGGAANKTKLPD